MRLRRETGDFQITINSENAVNTIRKGLSAEDFVGELVNVNGTYEVVNSANDTETGAEFKTNSFTLTYTKATGVITAQEGGSGSGSGSGSSPMIVAITHAENPSDPSKFDDYLESTWREIADGYLAGRTVLCERVSNDESNGDMAYHTTIVGVSSSGVGSEYHRYTVVTVGPDFHGNPTIVYTTTNPNGRPKYTVT